MERPSSAQAAEGVIDLVDNDPGGGRTSGDAQLPLAPGAAGQGQGDPDDDAAAEGMLPLAPVQLASWSDTELAWKEAVLCRHIEATPHYMSLPHVPMVKSVLMWTKLKHPQA